MVSTVISKIKTLSVANDRIEIKKINVRACTPGNEFSFRFGGLRDM